MKHCQIIVGNSSSGIIEAASLNKPVVNIGNRQKGRACSKNIIHSKEDAKSIIAAINSAEQLVGNVFTNIYEKENSSLQIYKLLKGLEFRTCYKFCDLD